MRASGAGRRHRVVRAQEPMPDGDVARGQVGKNSRHEIGTQLKKVVRASFQLCWTLQLSLGFRTFQHLELKTHSHPLTLN
jgi:hypothetical protein